MNTMIWEGAAMSITLPCYSQSGGGVVCSSGIAKEVCCAKLAKTKIDKVLKTSNLKTVKHAYMAFGLGVFLFSVSFVYEQEIICA